MDELSISIDENSIEAGTRELIKKIRPNWDCEIKFKVSDFLILKSI